MRQLTISWLNDIALNIQTYIASLRILQRELGLIHTLTIVAELKRRLLRGEPWKDLEAAESKKEAESRLQAAPAIVLYKILKRRYNSKRALAIVTKLVRVGAIIFLKTVIPSIDKADYDGLSAKDRRRKLQSLVDKFPNVSSSTLKTTTEHLRFKVNRCAFVELTARIGHPKLARIFCAGDKFFFEKHLPEVIFERPLTLAENNQPCDFRFRWNA